MAWVVPRSAVTAAHEEIIKQYLWLTPKKIYGESADAFRAYTTDPTNIYLPFYFGKRLFPTIPQPGSVPYPYTLTPPWGFKGNLRITKTINQITTVTEVTQQIYHTGTSSLNAFCGAGKTAMGICVGAWMNGITIARGDRAPVIICYTLQILEQQWIDSVTKFSTATYFQVRTAKGDPAKVPLTADIYLCMISGLETLPPIIRTTCQLLILDEAHLFCTANRLEQLLTVTPRTLLLLTATPHRPDGLETILHLLGGTHSVRRAAAVPFTIYRYNTGFTPPIVMNTQGKPDWTQIVNWLTSQDDRDTKILDWVRLNPTRTIALLTTRVEHAKKLHKSLLEMGERTSLLIGNTKSYSNCRVLVMGVSKSSTGFDQASACVDFDGKRIDLMLICVSIKAVFEQAVGRSFRALNPTVIFFVDTGKIFTNHWKEALKWCKDDEREGTARVEETNEPLTLEELENLD